MGILKGNLPVKRFRTGASERNALDSNRNYRVHAFVPIDPLSDVEQSTGWVPGATEGDDDDLNIRDAEIDGSLVLRVRIDVLKPPTAEVKRRLAERAKAYVAETGKPPSRGQRKLLKLEVVRELRQRILPRSRFVELEWNPEARRLRVFSSSKGSTEGAWFLFARTFGVDVDVDGPEAWTRGLLLRKLRAARPTIGDDEATDLISAGLGKLGPEPSMLVGFDVGAAVPDDANLGDGAGFLGREFLTWLLHRVATTDGGFVKNDAGPAFRVAFGGRCKLESSLRPEVAEATLKGGAPADSGDVLLAVRNGMTVREADLALSVDVAKGSNRVHLLTVEASAFDFKKSKLPGLLSTKEDAPEEVVGERLVLLSEAEACLRTAFEAFLALRLGSGWAGEVAAMREWLGVAGAAEVGKKAKRSA